MLIVTTEGIVHHRIMETRGQVSGVVVRSRGLGANILAGLPSLAGGEIKEYTQLLEDARRHATRRIIQNATAMGAHAVVRMQFDAAEIGTTIRVSRYFGPCLREPRMQHKGRTPLHVHAGQPDLA